MTDEFVIEIAVSDFASAKAAIEGGADRIELCAALNDGGLTPSFATIKKCRESFVSPLFPIIRPRSGDFLYNEEEYEIIKKDVLLCRQIGCDGIVVGFLQKNGFVDQPRLQEIIDIAYPLDVTFHRAFDRCAEPFEGMEAIIATGCQRILTSGQYPLAMDGAILIGELIKMAGGRIIIMPGSGVRKENIRGLAIKTGATEFHSSLRRTEKSVMKFIHPNFKNSDDSYTHMGIDPREVIALKKALIDPMQ